MGLQGDIGTHLWLTQGMAARVGVSLGAVLRDGMLTGEDFAAMATRCRTCGRPADCLSFQASAQADGQTPPGFCGNGALLAELQDLG